MIEKFYINGSMSAVVEYTPVNRQGKYDCKGDYVYIDNAYIRPEFRSYKYLKKIIKDIVQKVNATYFYFNRKKYKNRLSPLYKIPTKGV